MEPAWAFIAVFALTNRDKSPVSALLDEVGCYPIFCFAPNSANLGGSGFAVVQRLYRDSDSKRKPSDKRVAFSEGQ